MNSNLRFGTWLAAVVAASVWHVAAARGQDDAPQPVAAKPTVDAAASSEPVPVDSNRSDESEVAISLVHERYPSGAVKIERQVTRSAGGDYVPHGTWRFYDESGRLVIEGRFDHGQREGLWRRTYFGNEAALLATEAYRDFARPLISAATFHAGRLHGKWTVTDSLGRKAHEIELDSGQRRGAATWYYPSSAPLVVAPYDRGSLSGDVTQFAPDGTVIQKETFERGCRISRRREFHDDASLVKKQEVTYLEAELALKTPDHWDTLTLATFEPRGDDRRHGPFSLWHANGQLASKGQFHFNTPAGEITAWHPNGQKQLAGTYVDGRPHGVWTWWHANGQKAASGEYHDALPSGQWTWWNAAGELARKTDYSHSRPVVVAAEAIDETLSATLPTGASAPPLR